MDTEQARIISKPADEVGNGLLTRLFGAPWNYLPINECAAFFDAMVDNETYELIEGRARELAQWLEQESPYVQFDQRHLDGGTPQQAYWHLGYLSALRDILGLLRGESEHIPGRASPSSSADPGE